MGLPVAAVALAVVLGHRPVQGSTQWLARTLVETFLPLGFFLVPLGLCAWRWRRVLDSSPYRRLFFFTLLAGAARARHGWEGSAWYFSFFDFPAVAAFAVILFGEGRAVRRALTIGLAVMAVLGVVMTMINHPFRDLETVETAQGTIRTRRVAAETLRSIQRRLTELDPQGTRGVVALPYEALAYILGRRDPSGLTQGFGMTLESPEIVVDRIRRERPIVLVSDALIRKSPDHHRFREVAGSPGARDPNTHSLLAGYSEAPGENPVGPWLIYVPH